MHWPLLPMAILAIGIAVSLSAQTGDWSTLDRQAEELYTKGDLKEAIRLAKLAQEAARDPLQSARSLDRLGFFEYTAGSIADGEKHLRESLDIRKDKAGVESAAYAESANDLALLLRDSARLPAAQELAGQALAIRRRIFSGQHLGVAESLNTLASIVALQGDYETAITQFEEARQIHEAQPAPRDFSEEYGTLCVNLAGTYQRTGRYLKAEESFQSGLDVLRVKPGIGHPAYSASLVAFAYLQSDLGHFSAAEKLYDESGRLLREQLGEQHPVFATFLNNRAGLYASLGNVAAAESDYRRALELKKKIYGPDAPTVAASLRNLGRLLYHRNPVESEKVFAEAVSLYAKVASPAPFDYGSALLGLAEAQRGRDELRSARQSLDRASEIITQGLGRRHPLYAAMLRDSASVHQSAGETRAALSQIKDAISIIEETHGDGHPDLAGYLQRLAAIYVDTGDYAAAEPLYRRSLAIRDGALADMLAVGSHKNKSAVLAMDDPIPALITFQQKAGGRLPSARALAFEAVASRKGRIVGQVQDWGKTLRENSDAEIRARFAEWEAMLSCEASLTVAMGYRDLKPTVVGTCSLPGTELAGRYEKLLHSLRTSWTEDQAKQGLAAIRTLMQRIDTLEAALSRSVPKFASAFRPVRLAEVRSLLQPDEALAEFAVYSGNDGHRRYGVFFATRTDLEWLELGLATTLDRAVKDLITAANDRTVTLSRHENRAAHTAEETARHALDTLSAGMRPVLAWISAHPTVQGLRISPDGMFHLVPFSALRDERGHYLVERLAISYLSADRDLVTSVAPASPGPMIIALSPGRSQPAAAGTAGSTAGFRAELLQRLEGAAVEARQIRRLLPRSELLAEGQATEQRLKQLHHPALLHIIGHGLVRGNEDCDAMSPAAGCELMSLTPAVRVMSLSAIVLEEAYRRGPAGAEDGLLTALELETLDLQNTEMLVLSQCRMADGVPSTSDGVFGMRRAAAIAGVKTFVAPLWQVADVAEQSLMVRFYEELKAGKTRAQALRSAQLHLLRRSETASFFDWAPLIISGDPSRLPAAWFAPN